MSEDLELIEFLDQLTAMYPTYEYIRTEASANVLRKTKSAEYLVASTASVISIPSEDYNESDLYPLPPDVIEFVVNEVGPINIDTGSEAKRQLTGKSRRRSSVDSLLNPFKSKKLEAEMIVFQPDNFAMVVGSSASLTKHSDDDLLEVPLPAPSSQRKSSVDTLKAFAIRKLSTSIIPFPSPELIPQSIDNDVVADNITNESSEADKSSMTPPIPHKVRRASVDHGSISNSKRNSQKLVSFKLPTMSAFQTEPAKKIERAQTKVQRNERHPKAVPAIDDESESETAPIVNNMENTASNYMVYNIPDLQALIDSLRSECNSLKEQLESQASEFKEKGLHFEEERLELQQSIKNISQKSEERLKIMRNELGAKKQEFKRSEGEMKRILQEKNEQQETMQVEVAIMKQGISRKEAEWKNRLSANESLLGEAIHEKITLTEENRKFVDEVKLYTAKNSALLNENNQLRIALVDRYEAFRAAEIVRIEGQKKRNDAVMDLATVAESKGLIDFLNRKCDLLQKDLDDKHSELESQTLLHNDYVTKSEANCSLIKERVIALEEKERNLTTEIQQLCDNNLKLERNAEQMKEVHRISYQKYAETVEDLENQINDLRSQLEISQDAELKSKIAAEEALNRMVMKLSDLNTQARSITEVVDIENIKLKAENEMLQTQVNNLRNALESQMAKNECSEVSWKEMMQQFQLKLDTNAIKFKQSISKLEKANLELESQVKEAALRYSSADSSLKAQIIELRKRLESATENYEEAEALNEDLNLQLKSRSDGELAFKEQCLETQGKLEAQIKKLQEGEAVWMEQMMQFTAQLAAQSRAAQDAENASRLKFQEFKSKMNEKCKEYQDKLVAEKHENERLKKEITSANAQIQFLDVFKQELLQKEQYAKAENESLKTQIQELSQKIIYQNRDFETIESENRKENSRLESCIHDLQVTVVEMQEQSKKFEIIRADQDSESFRLKAATEAKLKELEALYSDQINDLVHKQEKAKNELTEEHKEILAFKEEKIRQLELQSAALRKEVTQHEINVQSMIADHAKELFEIQAKQSLELGALTAFAKTQEGLIENLKTTNASQIQSMKSNHQEEIENLHATYAAAANTIKISLNRQLSEMDGLTIAKKKEIESIRIEFDQAIQEHASQLQFLAESHNKEKEQISKKHELDLISLQANLATSHSREIQALRCEHEDLLNQVRSKDVAKIEESASIHERNVQEINELLKTTADDRAKFEENTHSLTLQLGEANTIIAQLREEIKSHHKKTSELNAVVEDTKKNFEIELESFKTSIHEKNCFIKALEAEKVLQSGLAKQFQSRLKEQYSTTLQAQLNAQIEAHQSQLEVLKIEFQKKNDALNGDLLSQLAISDAEVEKMRNLQSEYEFKIKILYEELQNSAALLQADVKEIGVKDALHKNETDKLKSAFEARLSDLKSDYDGLNETLTQTRSALSRSNLETLEIRNQYDAQILGMKNEFSETTRQYQAEIADSNRNLSELQTEVERLNAKYALDLVSIQEQIEAQAVKNKTQLGLMDQKITIQSEELEASLIKHNEAIIKMTLHHENEIEMSKARREALEIELDINQREMQKIKSNTLLEQLVAAQKFDSELVAQSGKYTKELKIKEAQFDTALQALKDDFAQSQSLQEHQSTQMANIYEESLKDREIKFRDLHKEYDAYKEDARKLEEELNLMLLAERRKAASLESNSKILSRRCDELNDELGTLKVKAEGLQSSLAAAEDLRTSQNAKLLAMQGKILFHTNLIQDLKLICFEFIENHDQQGSEELNFRDCFEKIFTDLNLKLRLAKNNLQELNITKDRERSEFTDTIEKLKLNLSQKSDEISTIYIELNRQKDLTRNLRAEIEDINENYVKLELSTKKLRTERTETIASFEESRALVSSLERKFQQKEGEISELNENSVGLKEKINSLKTQLANQLANSRSLEIKYLDLSNKLQDKESDCLVHLQKLVNHEETIKRMKEELESANANAAQAENEILKLDSLRSKETSVLIQSNNEFESQNKALTIELEQTKISIQKLQESFDLDTQRLKFEREMEMKLAQGELQQSENTVSTLLQKLIQKESEGAELEQSINDLKTRAHDLESMVASLHSSLSSNNAEFRNTLEKENKASNHLRAKLLEYESVITGLETKLNEVQKMVKSSMDELSNKDHLLALEAKRNGKLKEDLEELHSDLLVSANLLKQKQEELDISNNSRQILIAQVTELNNAKQLLDEEMRKSIISIKALETTTQEQVSQLNLFEAMVSKLSTEKEQFSTMSERLSHDLDVEFKNSTSLKESCAMLKAELDEMKTNVDELTIISNQKAEQSRQNEDQLMKENQSMAAQNEVFASLVSSLKSEISNINEISDIKSNDIIALTSRLNDLNGIENSLKLEVKDLKTLVQSLELEVKQLGERIVAEQTNFTAKLANVSKMAEAQESQLQLNISNLETDLANAKIDLERCQKDLVTAQALHEKDRTCFTTKEVELHLHLSSLDQKLNSCTAELVLLKDEKENADQHIKEIEQKLATSGLEAQTAIEINSQLSFDLEKLSSSYQELKEKQQVGISETLKLTNKLENDSSFLRRIISSDAKVAKLILRLFFEIGKQLKVTIPWTYEDIQEFPARVESSINSLPDPVILQMDENFGLQIIEAIKKIIKTKEIIEFEYRILKNTHENMQIDLSEMSAALELFKRNSILQQKEIQFTLGIYKKQIKSVENELEAMTLDNQKLSKELKISNHELHLKSRNLEKLERNYLIVAERLRHSKTGPEDQPDIIYQLHQKNHQLSNAKLLLQEYKEIINESGQKIQKLEEESRNLKNHNEKLLKVIEKGQIDSDWSQEELNRLNLESIQLKDTINQLKLESETLSDQKSELASKLELLQQKMQLQGKYLLATEKRLEHAIRGEPEKGSRVLKELYALEFNTTSTSERYDARQGQFSNFSATAFKPRLMDPNQILMGKDQSQILIPSLSAVL